MPSATLPGTRARCTCSASDQPCPACQAYARRAPNPSTRARSGKTRLRFSNGRVISTKYARALVEAIHRQARAGASTATIARRLGLPLSTTGYLRLGELEENA